MDNPFSAQYINSFLDAAANVFEHLLQIEITRGEMSIRASLESNLDEIEIRIAVVGDMHGVIAYCMSLQTGLELIKNLMPGISDEDAMDQCPDILGEIGNMISGNAITNLSKHIKNIDLEPPDVYFRNPDKQLPMIAHTTLVFIFHSDLGPIEANICLYLNKPEG